jgi:hypothetical protein
MLLSEEVHATKASDQVKSTGLMPKNLMPD